jgi:hypothetical protein
MDAHPLPARFTPHEVTIRALTGSGGMGRTYADPATVAAFVKDEVRMVRNSTGAEVVSSSTVTLGFDVQAPPGSLVTVWPGLPGQREAEVISSGRAAHPRLPAFQTLALT